MIAPRLARQRPLETHICPACELPFVEPEFAVQEGVCWRMALSCCNCGWSGSKLLDAGGLERFERALDAERVQLEADLERLIAANMGEYVECFTGALAVGAILPEDF
jgi:hypothetical protein